MSARVAIMSALAAIPLSASAQVAVPPPATPVSAAAPTATNLPAAPTAAATPATCCLIPGGTIVEIAIDDPLDSKTSVIGQHFALHLVTPLQLTDGHFVIAAGTKGVGEVIHAARAHMAGKAGELILVARYLDVDGVQVPLRGFRLGGQGKDNSGLVSAATISIGVVGMLISGGEKRVPPGSIATAKIAVDTVLPPLPAAAIPAAMPAATVTATVQSSPLPTANTQESHK
ncbi:hypothetical protein BH10PSE14_BH10PSE14_24940 [soil metagenome]